MLKGAGGNTTGKPFLLPINHNSYTGNKLEGDMGDIVSQISQTSPYFKLMEKFKCIENIDSLKLLEPENLNKTFQISDN